MKLTPVCLLAVAIAAQAADPNAEPKTHTLFMGADFSLQYKGQMYRVQDVVGTNFIILVNGKPVRVSTVGTPVGIKIQRGLKLSPVSATISHFSFDRGYAMGTNPDEKAGVAYTNLVGNQMANVTEGASSMQMTQQYFAQPPGTAPAASNPLTTPTLVNFSAGGTPTGPNSAGYIANSGYSTVQSNLIATMANSRNEDYQTSAYGQSEDKAAAQDQHNTLRVKFDLQADHFVRDPYVILIGLIHPPGQPHNLQQWVGAERLDALEPGQRVRFDLYQMGFAPGFQVAHIAIHVFDRGGMEIANSQADDRVELTREDAFRYLTILYLADHKHSTLPATPAMTKLPDGWRAHVGSPEFATTYFVKVDHTGHPLGVYSDPLCQQSVSDAYVSGMIMNVRFHPALNDGHAVDTVAQVVPKNLVD